MNRRRETFHEGARLAACLLLSILLSFAVLHPMAVAQTAEVGPEDPPTAAPEVDVAPVTVDGEELFMVIGVTADPAEERAAEIARRIVDVAEAGSGTPDFRIQRTEFGPAVYIDDAYITTVTKADEEFEGQDAPILAKRIGERVRDEILAYRERRSEEGITESYMVAVGWTAAFLIISAALRLALRFSLKRVDKRIVAWVRRVEERTGKIAKTKSIISITHMILWVVGFLIFVIWLTAICPRCSTRFPPPGASPPSCWNTSPGRFFTSPRPSPIRFPTS